MVAAAPPAVAVILKGDGPAGYRFHGFHDRLCRLVEYQTADRNLTIRFLNSFVQKVRMGRLARRQIEVREF